MRGLRQLTFAAVDKKNIGQLSLSILKPGVTSQYRLMQGSIVISAGDPFNIEAAIIALERALSVKHHTGSHSSLTHGMTDIEAFDPLRTVIETQCLLQGLETLQSIGLVGQLAGDGMFGIGGGKVQPPRPLAAHFVGNCHALAGLHPQGKFK